MMADNGEFVDHDLPVVGVELDSGPFKMAFGYVPIGEPAYSDVAPDLWPQPTYEEAEMVGARMLTIGNWRSFRIEKRWWPATVWLVEGSAGAAKPCGECEGYGYLGHTNPSYGEQCPTCQGSGVTGRTTDG